MQKKETELLNESTQQTVNTMLLFAHDAETKNKKIVIWGAGKGGVRTFELLEHYGVEVNAFLDSAPDKIGTSLRRLPIISPEILTADSLWNHSHCAVFIASRAHAQIAQQLKTAGWCVYCGDYGEGEYFTVPQNLLNHDFFKGIAWYEEQIDKMAGRIGRCEYDLKAYSKLHDDVVERYWSNDTGRQKWICMRPFERLIITHGGDVICCCANQTKRTHILGNVFTNTYEEIWNSDNYKKLRYCVSQGNFEYCYDSCPVLVNKELYQDVVFPREKSVYHFDRWQDASLDTTPKEINIGPDPSCNLHCVSCRKNVVVISKEENEKNYDMLMKVVKPMLKDCRRIIFSRGEFFFSESLQAFCKTLSKLEYPNLKIDMVTNGQLFTPQKWSWLENVRDLISCINVSIDAATKETYEKLRRGGKWNVLCDNMEFIASLKNKKEIDFLYISFVVQDENFREIPRFVELGKKWGVDRIVFARVFNTGSYTTDELKQADVFNHKHVHYGEAKCILQKIKEETKDIEIQENCLQDYVLSDEGF